MPNGAEAVVSFNVVAMCKYFLPMDRFYHVTFGLMIVGLAILCFYAPWTQPEWNAPKAH